MRESVTAEIVEAIAEQEGDDPTELNFSLQEYIDTDAVRLLMQHQATSWTLVFEVSNHEVSVSGDGSIEVSDSRTELDV